MLEGKNESETLFWNEATHFKTLSNWAEIHDWKEEKKREDVATKYSIKHAVYKVYDKVQLIQCQNEYQCGYTCVARLIITNKANCTVHIFLSIDWHHVDVKVEYSSHSYLQMLVFLFPRSQLHASEGPAVKNSLNWSRGSIGHFSHSQPFARRSKLTFIVTSTDETYPKVSADKLAGGERNLVF